MRRWLGNITADVAMDPGISVTAKAVYMVLSVHANGEGECFVNNTTVASCIGRSRNSVVKAMNELVTAGVIERTPRYVDGVQRSNVYTMLDVRAARAGK